MGVTVEVCVAAPVVKMRKELVARPDLHPFPASLCGPAQLMPASRTSDPCSYLWPDTDFTNATLSHEEVKACLFKVTKPGSSTGLSPLAPALISCLPLQGEVPGQCPDALGRWARTGSCTLTHKASVWRGRRRHRAHDGRKQS